MAEQTEEEKMLTICSPNSIFQEKIYGDSSFWTNFPAAGNIGLAMG